jgi:hypothetical protein
MKLDESELSGGMLVGDLPTNSDIIINSICFFFGTQALQMISILPALVVLTPCIPDNVEAAMTSLVTGTFVFSTDVGCKLSGGILCQYFGVSNDNLHRYWVILLAKCPMIIITIGLTALIPANEAVADAAFAMELDEIKSGERSPTSDDEMQMIIIDK